MDIRITLTAIITLFTSFVYSQKTVVINGSISNNVFTKVSFYHVTKENTLITTVSPDDKGSFVIENKLDSTDFFKLQFDESNHVMMILQPGERMKLSVNANDFLPSLKIEGSEETEYIYSNDKKINYFKALLDSINSVYQLAYYTHEPDSVLEISRQAYAKTEEAQNNYIRRFILDHPGSLACMFLVDLLSIDNNADVYRVFDSVIYRKFPNNYYVSSLHNRIQVASKLAVGAPAPELSLPDTSGVNITLSGLMGKIVIIDFWASWCGPCRKESPKMVSLYEKYHPKGLEIYGVSLDKSRAPWITAIKSDKLQWIHVSDLKYWQSEAARIYGVESIPYTVVVNRQGKIVAKGLRGDDLEKKISALLD